MKKIILIISAFYFSTLFLFSEQDTACRWTYFIKAPTCNGVLGDFLSSDPQKDNCMHWPSSTGTTYSVPLTQSISSTPSKTLQYNATDANTEVASCCQLWSDACCGNIVWVAPSYSGTIYYEATNTNIDDDLYLNVIYCSSNLAKGIITEGYSTCCFYHNNTHGAHVVFQNSSKFYIANPQVRWTTTDKACNGTSYECYDVMKLTLNSLGLYLGLDYDYCHDYNIMYLQVAYNSNAKRDWLGPCDVERIRMLYSCKNSVSEEIDPKKIDFKIYPTPNNKENLIVTINMLNPVVINIFITDIDGKTVVFDINKQCNVGNNLFDINIGSLPAGVYFLKMEYENKFCEQKFIIQK